MKILSEEKWIITPAMMASRTFRHPPNPTRSPGIHVQAINKKLGIAAGKLDDSDLESFPFERFSDTVYPLMPALGVAWEEFRVSFYTEDELLWQPFELERDGVFGTPDGLLTGGAESMLWECKQTTKKVQSIAGCWMYLKQGMAYCAMSGQTKVCYDVNWVLGDYTRPYKPVATTTVVEFKESEVETWWENMMKAKTGVRSE